MECARAEAGIEMIAQKQTAFARNVRRWSERVSDVPSVMFAKKLLCPADQRRGEISVGLGELKVKHQCNCQRPHSGYGQVAHKPAFSYSVYLCNQKEIGAGWQWFRNLDLGSLHARAVQGDGIKAGRGGDEKLMFGAAAETDIGHGFGDQDLAQQPAIGRDTMHAITG